MNAGRRTLVATALAGSVFFALACSGADESVSNTAERTAAAIEDHECAACGMLVRDQPAPRGQALHRDGTEAFTCSVGDLLVHLSAPSPHGGATSAWVEVMDPGADPSQRATHAHRWVSMDDAWYVVGVQRRGIMGPPVLAYADEANAEAVAQQHDGALLFDRVGLEAWWEAMQR